MLSSWGEQKVWVRIHSLLFPLCPTQQEQQLPLLSLGWAGGMGCPGVPIPKENFCKGEEAVVYCGEPQGGWHRGTMAASVMAGLGPPVPQCQYLCPGGHICVCSSTAGAVVSP